MVVCPPASNVASHSRNETPRDENITAENLDEVHRRTSVNCTPLETVNVPLTQPRSPATETDGNLPEEPISAVYRRAWARAESRGIFTSGSQPGRENQEQRQFSGSENLGQGQFPGRENLEEGERFHDEAARLRSFRGWPPGAPVQPEVLAAAGFYYTGTGDRVCCAFCEGVLSGWERGDDPTTEHDRHYGDRNCPFRRHQRRERHDGHCHGSGPEVYCNDQLRSGLPMTTTPRERTTSWSEQTTVSRNESPSRTLNLMTNEQSRQVPRHPEFADQLQRFRSYPLAAFQTGQRAESLARAGFFYEGPEDRVRCFHCAGLLKDWKPADLPLDEHQKWFPGCQFLQSLRNDVSLQDNSRQMQSAAFSVGLTAAHFSSASGYPVESREIKARMDSASVVALLQMGFSKTLIRQVIEIRLRTIGDDFPSAESLLEAVFELQEKMALEESSARPRGHGNGEPAGHVASSTTPYVIVAADKKELVQTTAYLNQLPNQMAQTSDASASNKSSTDTPASEAASSIDASNSQPPKQKNKTRRRQKKCSQKKTPDNVKTTESNEEVKIDNAEGSMDTGEADPTGLDEEAEVIVQENRQLKEARTCKVCLDAEVNMVFLPCGHLVCCHSCSSALKICPMCRVLIRGTVRVFLP